VTHSHKISLAFLTFCLCWALFGNDRPDNRIMDRGLAWGADDQKSFVILDGNALGFHKLDELDGEPKAAAGVTAEGLVLFDRDGGDKIVLDHETLKALMLAIVKNQQDIQTLMGPKLDA
jgi:hypothetical protein